jgi:Fur family peroxide stress response transcriptional regulator
LSRISDDIRLTRERLHEVFRRAGLKLTHQRMVIYQAVTGNDQHPDAETVHRTVREQMPSISLDTVYRTLWLLRDLDLISTMGPPREKTRFDGNTSRHHHFVCAKCGLVQDFSNSDFDGGGPC